MILVVMQLQLIRADAASSASTELNEGKEIMGKLTAAAADSSPSSSTVSKNSAGSINWVAPRPRKLAAGETSNESVAQPDYVCANSC
ncbi:hypothetical protein GOP47_0001991 [Adiantum capillus-veneris]|uniref:Uncharacterized protein n=1 Tax=Adiantum capillus-veneris TaxID=13818 RepID=A0A9D4VAU4_ADICA|nr:hypothetical protein GOP47_0001991 [Adiantum capillus-veneris]